MRRINVLHKNHTPSKQDKQNFESLMKTHIKNPFLLPALIAGLGLIMVGRATAQIVTNLTIIRSAANVILTWPTNATGFTLQSTTNLVSPVVWTTVVPGPVVVNGNNTVTNPISGSQKFYRLSQSAIRSGMALIPAGSFTMGDSLDGESDATPTVSVTVSAFYMDVNLVSYSQWQTVYNWATSHGYGFDYAGAGKAANQPVQTVDWYDTVKWSNARSQQAGLTPVYYTDAGLTQVYTSGQVTPYVNWAANGYRLPTEAEWEKAARGGLSGRRFPLGNTISESQANYYGDTSGYSYDLGPNGYNSIGIIGGSPYTSPVGSFAPNGYGLYDMAGNVFEWCWDWYGTPYGQPTTTNPTGPASGSTRVLRGGYWSYLASYSRCAYRNSYYPFIADNPFGFRCVTGL
jgi:formylglycine-generating enzyme required for sulfatase activity